MNKFSPIVSEFDSFESAVSYARWLREKVDASLGDARPRVPHDEAMARVRAIIAALGMPTLPR